MLSVDEEEEEEEDDEEEEEKKDEVKEVKNKKLIKEEKKVKEPEKDDINDGSFITQPPVKLVNKLNNNNHTIKNDNKSKSENTNKNSNINDVKIDNINNKNINNNSINIIQKINPDKKSSIIVAIRVRPLNQTELKITSVEGIKILDSNSLIVTSDPSAPNKKTNLIKEHQFFFDYVYGPTATQEAVYQGTAQKLLPDIINGFNATVFAYGATGSGKTYTMLGTINKEGIMTRSISDLFKLLNSKKNKEFEMEVSYIEIYNEIIRDLLAEGNVIDIHEDPNIGVILQGVKEIEVENSDSFYDILSVGNKKRTTGSTNNNETSSRSHAVLRVNLHNKDRNSNDIVTGKFILVDLAGSEKDLNEEKNSNKESLIKNEINIEKKSINKKNENIIINYNGTGKIDLEELNTKKESELLQKEQNIFLSNELIRRRKRRTY